MVNLSRNRVCFDVPEDVARTVRRLSDPEARATALLAHFTERSGQTHHTHPNRTTDATEHTAGSPVVIPDHGPAPQQSASASWAAERAQGVSDTDVSHMEAGGPLTLRGTYIYQGNGNGAVTNKAGTVLFTSDLGPCVAVCGYNGSQSFMIHSDSTGAKGSGFKDLISGLRQLVFVGAGDGWTISLIGGSTAGTSAYLRRSENLPRATVYDLGESEGAYITETGVVAISKRRLARSLQSSDIYIHAPGGGIPDTVPTGGRMFGSHPGVSADHIPATTDHEIDAAGVELDGKHSGTVADNEQQTLMERIANEFGVRIDSSAGIKAVKATAPDALPDETDKVQPLRWEQSSLEQVYAALKHYAPVLGPQRAHSNRAGSDQEVETIGSVTSGLVDKRAMHQLAGAYFKHFRLVNVYKSGRKVDRLGSNPERMRLNSVGWVVSHEMAHGLFNYALRDFTKKFWEGIEPPLAVDGYAASSPAEDFREAIRIVLQGPEEKMRFALRSPRHAKAMGELRARLPEVFARRAGESPSDAGARIAEELKGELSWFISRVSTTWTHSGDRFFGKEEPISAYARTNADEDLAETAMYFFNDGPYLWKHAPERAAFVNGLVASWTKVTGPHSEDHPTAHHVGNTDAQHTLAQERGESARAVADPALRQAGRVSPVSLPGGAENSDEMVSRSGVGAKGPQAASPADDGTGSRSDGADVGSAAESGEELGPGFAAFWNRPQPTGRPAAETAPGGARSATVDGAGSEPADVVADVLRLRAMASDLLEFHSQGAGADLRTREGVRRLEEAFLGDAQALLVMRLLAERSPDGAAVDAAARGFVREWLSQRLGVDADLPVVGVRSGDREADAGPEEEIGDDLFDVRGYGVGTGDLFVSVSGRLVHADGPRLRHADMSADFAVNNTAALVTGNDPVHRTGEFASGWTSWDVRRAAVLVFEDPAYVVPDLENPGRSIRSGTVDGVSIDVAVTTGGKISSVRRSQIVRFDQGRHGLSREGERNLNLIADRLAVLAARNHEAGFPPPLVTVRGTGTRGGPLALADMRRIDAVSAHLERATRVVGIDLNVVRRHAEISARQAERFGPHTMGMLRRQVAVTIDSHASHIGRRAIRLLDGQAESDRRLRLTDLFPTRTPRSVPAQVPISAEDQARIVYSEAAQDFERRLGDFLVHHPPVVQFVHDLIGRLWNLVQDEAPHLLTRFGTRDPHRAGAVGNDLSVLRSTMESGNLREQLAMLWNGHDNALFDVLFDRLSVYPVEIENERRDRRAVAEVDASRQLPVRESDIVPPLSHRERDFSGIPDSDAVVWRPAPTAMEYPLASGLHLAGTRTGALISTGTSGSTYFLLGTAEDLSIRTGTPIRMDLMRLALLGNMLATRTHTFHEVMSSAQLWDTERDGRYELRYADNWGRYRRLDPIDEETLRREVARDGLFPDEIALDAGTPEDARDTSKDAPASARPGASAGVVSAPPVQGSPEDGRMAALREALRPDLFHAVRPWEGSFDEEVARLRNILEEGGSRSIVFGNWDEAPVWVVKMNDTNSLGWFDRYFQTLPDGPSFAHGPVASIDIGHSGALVGPTLLRLRSLDREATEGTKLTYCDIGPGHDFAGLFLRNVPW